MFKRMKFALAAIVASGLLALDPVGASAMPVAPKGAVKRSAVDMGVELAHVVRVCMAGAGGVAAVTFMAAMAGADPITEVGDGAAIVVGVTATTAVGDCA